MPRGTHLFWLPAALPLLWGYAVRSPDASAAVPPTGGSGIVYFVDGAGGFEASSRIFRESAAAEKMPLEVRPFRWTHGFCRVLADETHAAHMQRVGRQLADLVLQCRHESPGRPVFLVGHSAGCGVVLTAAEDLPPATVERIVLLAPAVSVEHDLRPALASSRGASTCFTASTTGPVWVWASAWPERRIATGRWRRPARSAFGRSSPVRATPCCMPSYGSIPGTEICPGPAIPADISAPIKRGSCALSCCRSSPSRPRRWMAISNDGRLRLRRSSKQLASIPATAHEHDLALRQRGRRRAGAISLPSYQQKCAGQSPIVAGKDATGRRTRGKLKGRKTRTNHQLGR